MTRQTSEPKREEADVQWRRLIHITTKLLLYKWVGRVARISKKKYEYVHNFDGEACLPLGQSSVLLKLIL
jgi:hypothetical protein